MVGSTVSLEHPMLPPIAFVTYVRRAKPSADREVMARVALNVLYDPERYPVDLSEVSALACEARLMTRGFLAWCAIEQKEWLSWQPYLCDCLIKLLPATNVAVVEEA